MNKCIKIGVSLQLTLLIRLPEAGDSKATKQEEAKGDIDFFGPKWHSPNSLVPFHRVQKSLDFQLALVKYLHASKTLRTGPYKS